MARAPADRRAIPLIKELEIVTVIGLVSEVLWKTFSSIPISNTLSRNRYERESKIQDRAVNTQDLEIEIRTAANFL